MKATHTPTPDADANQTPTDLRRNTVKASLTSLPRQKRRDVVENDEFAAFARRIIRAHGRRVATGDVEALRDLVALSATIDQAITDAVIGLRAFGYSWAEIGARLGISRQAAQQRWSAAA